MRLTPSGSPDPAFGAGGLVTSDFGSHDDPDAMDLGPGGNIFVSGTTETAGVTEVAVAAYTPAGAPDTAFAPGGKEIVSAGLPGAAGASADFSRVRLDEQFAGPVQTGVFATIAQGELLVGAGEQGGAGAAASASSVRRLLTTFTPLPAGSLVPPSRPACRAHWRPGRRSPGRFR